MITNYLNDLMLCLRPEGSEPEEVDEFSPELLDIEMKIFNTEME